MFPSYCLTWGQNVVEVVKIMGTSFRRSHALDAALSAPDPAAGRRPMPLPETPGHSWASLGQSLVGDSGIWSHHFMANRWGNSGNSENFIFLGSTITVDSDCSHEIKRHLLLGSKVMTNLDSILKSRDITLPTKVRLVIAMVFPVITYGYATAAAAAKSLQSCPTLCDPVDISPPGSPVPGILQARILECVAISFSNVWKWKVKVKSPVVSDSYWPHELQPTRLLHPWDFLGKSTGVACHCLLWWIWELDYKERWALKNWCFWTVVLEKTLESPLDCKEIRPGNHKGNPEYSLEGLMLKLKLQYFGHLMRRTDSLEMTLLLGKIEGRRRRGQERMRCWKASQTRWMGVWASSGS